MDFSLFLGLRSETLGLFALSTLAILGTPEKKQTWQRATAALMMLGKGSVFTFTLDLRFLSFLDFVRALTDRQTDRQTGNQPDSR